MAKIHLKAIRSIHYFKTDSHFINKQKMDILDFQLEHICI